jgi:hypothetical protein
MFFVSKKCHDRGNFMTREVLIGLCKKSMSTFDKNVLNWLKNVYWQQIKHCNNWLTCIFKIDFNEIIN